MQDGEVALRFSPWDVQYVQQQQASSAPQASTSEVPVNTLGPVGFGRPVTGLIRRRKRDKKRQTKEPVAAPTFQEKAFVPVRPLISAWPPLDQEAKNDLTARFIAQMVAYVLIPDEAEVQEEMELHEEYRQSLEKLAGDQKWRLDGKKCKKRRRKKRPVKSGDAEIEATADENEGEEDKVEQTATATSVPDPPVLMPPIPRFLPYPVAALYPFPLSAENIRYR